MCGIVGMVDFKAVVSRECLTRMAEMIKHRGPDGEGFWCDSQVGLGCRRLAIVDVPHGHQPTSNEDSSIQVVFNGEIYNHRTLRQGLQSRGHCFRSHSDVEVIPHLYEEHGLEFVDELDGDFAIALWDGRRQRLVLTRDRVGVKPLFYHVDAGRLIFASEVKGIFASGLCAISVDPQGLSDCFFYSHPIAPQTFWAGVRDVEPGTLLSFDRDGARQQTYFRPFQRPDPTRRLLDGGAAIDSFRQVFTEAVKKRIPDEVNAGIALSGGIDSTAIAAVAARVCQSPLPTCSIQLADDQLDETQFSRHVARELGLENREVPISGSKACEVLPRSLWHFESPFWFGAVSCPFFEMTRVAQRLGYKVAMSGDGSDELMAGYDFYRLMKLSEMLTSWKLDWIQPVIWRNAVKWTGGPAGIDTHIRQVNAERADHQRQYGEVPPWIYIWSAIAKVARPVLDGKTLPPPSRLLPPPDHDRLRRQLHFEFVSRLPNWILVISDRLGMANGIEVRVPFLDRALIDLCSEVTPDMLLRRGVEKYILRRALRGVAPDRIVRRRKRPFLTPIAPWYLSGPGRELAGDHLSRAAVRRVGLFDPDATEALWKRAIAPNRSWDTMVAEWVSLMILSTHMLVEQFTTANLARQAV